MKRILIKQMRNEWRDNLWLVLALTIVLIAIWMLSLMLWKEIEGIIEPLGFESEDVYTLKVEALPSESPEYVDYGDERGAMEKEDRINLMRQIRQSAHVAAAAWSNNCTPYNFGFWGSSIYLAEGEKDTIGYEGNFRRASPDMAKVLRFRSHSGKTPEQLSAFLAKGDLLISNTYGKGKTLLPEDMPGKPVKLSGDSTKYRIADVIDHIRRSDYEIPWGGTVVIPIDDENPGDVWDIILRVKPGHGTAFAEEFENTPAMQQHRNFYLSNLTKLTDKRNNVLREADSAVRSSVGVMLIFLIVILLGLLGTYWFRVQQRFVEIAVRKVFGANKKDIFRRVLSEGLLLLLMASIVSLAIAIPLVKFGKIETLAWNDVTPLFVAGAVAVVIVASGIVLSIGYPAWRAMRIEPAVAVKEE